MGSDCGIGILQLFFEKETTKEGKKNTKRAVKFPQPQFLEALKCTLKAHLGTLSRSRKERKKMEEPLLLRI